MKNYIKNTLVFISIGLFITACGSDKDSKTFSTRTGKRTNSNKTNVNLTPEQKVDKTLEALTIAKNSLSEMISNSSEEIFEELPSEFNQASIAEVIRNIKNEEASSNTQRIQEDETDATTDPKITNTEGPLFSFDETSGLTATAHFFNSFDANSYVGDPAVGIYNIYKEILTELHLVMTQKTSETSELESSDWATIFLQDNIGRDNLRCSLNDLTVLINKPTGLVKLFDTESVTNESINDYALFGSPEIFENEQTKETLILKFEELSDKSIPSETVDIFKDIKLNELLSIGRPTQSSSTSKLTYSAESSGENKTMAEIIEDSTNGDAKFNYSFIDSNGKETKVDSSECVSLSIKINTKGIIAPSTNEASVEETAVTTDEPSAEDVVDAALTDNAPLATEEETPVEIADDEIVEEEAPAETTDDEIVEEEAPAETTDDEIVEEIIEEEVGTVSTERQGM